MTSERLLSGFAVAAVILITVRYLVATEPEKLTVTSGDNVVTVAGLARQTQPLSVRMGDIPKAPMTGLAYDLSPDRVILDEPVVINFKILDSQQTMIEHLVVYRFHPSLEMWEAVTPIIAHTDEAIAVETAQLGRFALGDVPMFEAPVFASTYDELRAKAPIDAVGYEIDVGFMQSGHDPVRLLSQGEHGGCNGVVRVGDSESLSRLERQAAVTLDDQVEIVTFVFVTRWFTSNAGGCSKDEPLRPLAEYDILNTIQI